MALQHDGTKLESMRKGAKEMGERKLHLTRELEKCEQKHKEMERQHKEGVVCHASPTNRANKYHTTVYIVQAWHEMLLRPVNIILECIAVQSKIKAIEQDLRDLDCKKGSVACVYSKL